MLKNVIGLVTGGGSGLGKGVVERIVREGGRVAVCDLPSSKGNEVAEALGKDNCIFCPTDVTKEDDVKSALDTIKSDFGGHPNAVVNCAGIGIATRIYNKNKGNVHNLDEFTKVQMVNTVGTFNVMRLAVQRMAENPLDADNQRGVIVNTASVAAFDGQMGQVAYSASKGAIVGMTLPAARDLAEYGIRVNCIAPGLFDTPLLASLPPKVRSYLAKLVPNPSRLGDPDEFAKMVQAIIDNNMMNGETVRLDGGLRMPP